MKAILSALKTAIANGMPELRGVYVVADPDLLPPAAQYPCAGLKDGTVARSEGAAETVDQELSVEIYLYVRLLQNPEASIMGAGTAKGLLDYMEDLHGLLHLNTMEVDDVLHGFCPEEYASEMLVAEGDVFIQRKGCRYQYEK